jgi:hypothetical protein
MTQNALEIWPQIIAVVGGFIVLFIFGLTIVLPLRTKKRPGSSGHRAEEDETGHEEIKADGYIDSFAGTIEEAGGGMPVIVKLALPGVLLWWLIYLIINWVPN